MNEGESEKSQKILCFVGDSRGVANVEGGQTKQTRRVRARAGARMGRQKNILGAGPCVKVPTWPIFGGGHRWTRESRGSAGCGRGRGAPDATNGVSIGWVLGENGGGEGGVGRGVRWVKAP